MTIQAAVVGVAGVQGAAGPNFTGDPYTIVDFALTPADARAELQLLDASDVVRQLRLNSTNTDIGNWGGGSLDITDYDFRLDTTTGTLNGTGSQAADTWITGFNGMRWGVEETGIGTHSFTGTLRVRPTGGGSDFDTASVSLSATSTP